MINTNKEEMIKGVKAENNKGFHITITDLDSREIYFDEDVKGILGAVRTDNGTHSTCLAKETTFDTLCLINAVEYASERVKQGLYETHSKKILDKILKELRKENKENE